MSGDPPECAVSCVRGAVCELRLSCVDPMTGATWVAAGTERLEVVPGLVKSDDEEEGPP